MEETPKVRKAVLWLKRMVYWAWLATIIIGIIYFFVHPEVLSAEYLKQFFLKFEHQIWVAYIMVTFLRGFFLIPGTPFVWAGALLFPDNLFAVACLSITGVLFSATMLYYFADVLGFSKRLEEKYPDKMHKLQNKMRSPKAFFFVIGWAFFPLVPTELICYLAGISGMPYRTLFSGLAIGEIPLIFIYVYLGSDLMGLFF